MDPLRFIAESQGFFTRAMAAECGYSTRTFDRTFKSGRWIRFRHGYYTFPDLWRPLDGYAKHRILCVAVLHSLGRQRAALTHVSSLIMQGLEPWGFDLTRVHVTRLDKGASRVEGDIAHHASELPTNQLIEFNGTWCSRADRAALEASAFADGERSLCVFNQVLHAGLCDLDQLYAAHRRMQNWPGMRSTQISIRLADARPESVGESRGFWMFWSHGLPAPQPQFEVYDGPRLLGTCDWGWPDEGLLGEFDGRAKYGRLLSADQDPGAVVFAEKQREDLMREVTGMAMIRLVWADFARPGITSSRVKKLMRRVG